MPQKGVTIRRATADDAVPIARVRVDGWRTSYRGLVPKAYLDSMSVEASAVLWEKVLAAPSDRTSVFVAEDGDGVVGFAAGNLLEEPKHGFDAELSAVYLRQEFQRAGLGRRLVGTIAAAERSHGASGLIVWVIAGNKGARRFYETLGAELVIEQPFEWDGMNLVEAGYGWRDLGALIEAGGLAALH